jgi:3-hydroxyisobutyrate dehydrogenase-like beta-hydroxyacid dehydrogenase
MTGSGNDDMGKAKDRVHQPGRDGQSDARRLMAAGYPLTVYNRTWAKADSLAEQGAAIAEPPHALAAGCD